MRDLDLVGATVDLKHLGVARELLDLVLGHVAVSTEELHGFERHLHRALGAVQLAGRRLREAHGLARTRQLDDAEHQVLDVHSRDLHLGELELDQLELTDGTPELHPGLGVLHRLVEALLNDSESHRDHAGALGLEGVLGTGAVRDLLRFAEQPVLFHEDVAHEQLPRRRRVHAHLAQGLGLLESLLALLDHERQHLAVARVVALVELADEHDGVGPRPVGDEGLVAVQHVAAVGAARGGLHLTEGVRSRPRLGDGPGADLVQREQILGPAFLLRTRATAHDGARGQAGADTQRRDHAGAMLGQLDDGDHLHRGHLARHGVHAALLRLGIVAGLQIGFGEVGLVAHERHVPQPKGREHLAQHLVGRSVAVFELFAARLDLRVDEAAKCVADSQVLLAPFDHVRVSRSLAQALAGGRRILAPPCEVFTSSRAPAVRACADAR